MVSGTTDSLKNIGVRDSSRAVRDAGLDYLEEVSSGWAAKNAFFKGEGGQVNIGLGQGKALEIFNNNIIKHDVIRGP
ncbi:hypothetical protein [Gimesia maris]|uniref:hypothetical protein n=1 Tax=Gimesia maris TaxID=122 RepID=UPI0005C4616F|nr:hypothetical protein [Gimesia maris]